MVPINYENLLIPTTSFPFFVSNSQLHDIQVKWYVDVMGIKPVTAGILVTDRIEPTKILGKSAKELEKLHNIGPHRAPELFHTIQAWLQKVAPNPDEIPAFPQYR